MRHPPNYRSKLGGGGEGAGGCRIQGPGPAAPPPWAPPLDAYYHCLSIHLLSFLDFSSLAFFICAMSPSLLKLTSRSSLSLRFSCSHLLLSFNDPCPPPFVLSYLCISFSSLPSHSYRLQPQVDSDMPSPVLNSDRIPSGLLLIAQQAREHCGSDFIRPSLSGWPPFSRGAHPGLCRSKASYKCPGQRAVRNRRHIHPSQCMCCGHD